MNIAETISTGAPQAIPARRPRWILLFLFAAAARIATGWLVPTFQHYSLPGSAEDKAEILGFADDGSLITSLETVEKGTVGAWKWTLPELQKMELWSQTVDSESRNINDDAIIELRDHGKLLSVFPPRSQPQILIDTTTGRAVDGESPATKRTPIHDWEFVEDRASGSEVRDRRTGKSLGRIDEADIEEVSPDGRWVAGVTGRQLRVWKVGADGVALTDISAAKPESPVLHRSSWMSAPAEGAEFPCVAFSADSSRFFVYGVNCLKVFETKTGDLLHHRSDIEVFAISNDEQMAYALWDGQKIVQIPIGGLQEDDFDLRIQETNIDLRLKDWEVHPMAIQPPWVLIVGENRSMTTAPPLVDVTAGPIRLVISNDAWSDQLESFFFVNLETHRKLSLPATALPQPFEYSGEYYRIVAHSNRFAFQNVQTGEIGIVEPPSASLEFRRTSLAILLFALPGWWCWRGKRQKDQPVYKPSTPELPATVSREIFPSA